MIAIERGTCEVCDWDADLIRDACEACWRERFDGLSAPAIVWPTGALRERMRDEAAAVLARFEAEDEARP